MSDRVLVSDRVRRRSSSPWSSALHPGRSASEFFRSTSVLGEAAPHYTTRLANAHETEFRELLYPWHPWYGLRVGVYTAVEKSGGIIFRCNLTGSDADRWLEIPALDVRPVGLRQGACGGRCLYRPGGARGACSAAAASIERPFCIIECAGFGRTKALSRPESGRDSCHTRRGRCRCAAARRGRWICSQENRRRRSATASVVRAAGGDTSGTDRPDDTVDPGACRQQPEWRGGRS